MKKQLIILLTVVCALMATLVLAACSQSSSTGSGSGEASSSAAEASASVDVEATASEDAQAEVTEAAADADGYTGLPAFQPVDHEGRTYEQCPTCHDGSTAPAIPDDHFVNGELDGARLQCVTCHVVEPAA